MLKTRPFDPADYFDSEEGVAAYLADARLDGAEAVADAHEVVARARARMAGVRSGADPWPSSAEPVARGVSEPRARDRKA